MKSFKITYQENSKIKTITLKANGIDEIDLPLNIINIKESSANPLTNLFNHSIDLNKSKNTITLFNELNIMLKSRLPLAEAINILKENTKNQQISNILDSIETALKNGKPIYKRLEIYKNYFGQLPISFFKLGEQNGNLNDSINSLSIVLNSIEENKKQIISSLSYPLTLFIMLGLSMVFIFTFVMPNFDYIFMMYKEELPLATKLLLNTKEILIGYFGFIATALLAIVLLFILKYKNSLNFRYKIDRILVSNIPILSTMLFLSSYHRFFLSTKLLLESKYQFQTAFNNSKIIVNNSYLQKKLDIISSNINNGKSIANAFEESLIFDDFTIRLINTGEKSNSLEVVISEIEKIYKQKLDRNIKLFSSMIEPVFLLFMTVLIVWLVLAIFLPIWQIGSVIK